MDKLNITPTMIKDYIYCPALVWMKHNYETKKQATPSMQAGKTTNLKEYAKKLGLPNPILIEKCLEDKELGLSGCPDIIAGEKNRIVLEVKRFPRKKSYAQYFLVQAKAYAVLVERILGNVKQYGLVLGEELYLYQYHQKDQKEIEKIVEKISKILQKQHFPQTTQNSRKCVACDYVKECIVGSNNRALYYTLI